MTRFGLSWVTNVPKGSFRKDAHQFVGRNNLELLVGAVLWSLVRTPAAEVREVTEACALHVLVGDLDDELDAERLPAQVFACAPS